jgi:acetyltransferase-like isoleucine patch superfamily enzyme
MSLATAQRTIPGDWYHGSFPPNVSVDVSAYIETSYSFLLYRSELPEGLRIGRGSSTYLGTMFDVGPWGRVSIGKFSLIHGAWFICDSGIEVGDYCLISWNVVFMDTYGVSSNPEERRSQLEAVPFARPRRVSRNASAKPVRIGRNVWIGFDSVILPGVTIGDGSVIGARSVVIEDVPPFSVAAGNPATIVRKIENDEISQIH